MLLVHYYMSILYPEHAEYLSDPKLGKRFEHGAFSISRMVMAVGAPVALAAHIPWTSLAVEMFTHPVFGRLDTPPATYTSTCQRCPLWCPGVSPMQPMKPAPTDGQSHIAILRANCCDHQNDKITRANNNKEKHQQLPLLLLLLLSLLLY